MSTLKVNAIQSNTTQSINVNSNLGNISNIEVAGVGTFSGGIVGNITGNVNSSGVSTIATLNVTQSNPTRLNVSGVSTFAAGSVSAPSISATGDSNTGIFFPSPDTIAFAEGGVEGFRLDSNNRLGIGITNPQGGVHIVSNSTGGYLNLVISQSVTDAVNRGGAIAGARKSNANSPFAAYSTWDDGTNRICYVGGGGWGLPEATQVSLYTATTYNETTGAALERLKIDSGGRVAMPYQPSFYTVGTNYSQSAAAYSIIIPNGVSYNLGSHYNGSTGRFTAPIAGRYIFGFWGLSYPHNTEVNQIRGFVNGSVIGQEVQFGGAAHLHIQATGNLLLNLNANDIFDWRYYQASGSAKAYGSQWNMWGYLLG
jgi:hypothetical protein